MRLPEAKKALIEPKKLRDYVLSSSHPVGRFKEAVFTAMGYTRDDWERLEMDIRAQHLPLEVSSTVPSKFGQKYVISGPIAGPNGRILMFKSVWIVLNGQSAPRLVTIYPEGQPS